MPEATRRCLDAVELVVRTSHTYSRSIVTRPCRSKSSHLDTLTAVSHVGQGALHPLGRQLVVAGFNGGQERTSARGQRSHAGLLASYLPLLTAVLCIDSYVRPRPAAVARR